MRATDLAVEQVAAVGAPPVVGGEVVAGQVRSQLTDLRADLADARAQLEGADPAGAVAAAANIVASFVNRVQAVATLRADPRLAEAFEQAPQCAPLRGLPG